MEKAEKSADFQINEIRIRFAELRDVEKIVSLYDIALEKLDSKAKREFIREKIRLHILSPFSHILTAWNNNEVVAFVMYTTNEKEFANFTKRPRVLLRAFLRFLIGAYGFNPRLLFKLFLRFFVRAKQKTGKENLPFTTPPAYLSAYATHPAWRGKGIASACLRKMLRHLEEIGVKGVWAEVHHLNAASLHTLAKLGFKEQGIFRHTLGGHLVVMVKSFSEGGEENA
jgi:RimJ/RimL family protein N-acetyltransferase